MEIGDERADVAGVLGLNFSIAVLERAHDALHRRGPAVPVALVDAVVLADIGGADAGVREQELADRGVEREAVHALASGVDQHRARAVEDVPGRRLAIPRLQAVTLGRALLLAGDAAVDREDRADRDVDVDVHRAVERIVEQHVLALLLPRAHARRLVLLGGGDAHAPGVLDRVAHRLVGEHVELLLQIAGHVEGAAAAEDVGQTRPAHLARDDLRREAQVVEQVGELARSLRVEPFLLHDEALNRHDGRE